MQEQPQQQPRNLLVFFAFCLLLFAGWLALKSYLWPPPPPPPDQTAEKKDDAGKPGGPEAPRRPLPPAARPPLYVSALVAAAAGPDAGSVAVYAGLAFREADKV